MTAKQNLSEIVHEGALLSLIEPDIYSLYHDGRDGNIYDHGFGTLYDLVACNRLYNWMVWGYSTSEYRSFCSGTLDAAGGLVLDAGCGSLAFTAETYVRYPSRVFVCMDQSVKMLKLARSRLLSLCGRVPDNIFLLHGNVLRMPFRAASFPAVISLNVLHVINDLEAALSELKSMVSHGGTISITTMVQNNRFADRYLCMLGTKGMVIPRTTGTLFNAMEKLDLAFTCRIKGNVAFIICR